MPENREEGLPPEARGAPDTNVGRSETIHREDPESTLGYLENTSIKAAEAALATAKTIEQSSLSTEHKGELRTKLQRSLKKILRVLSVAAALTGATGLVDYATTRYRVESEVTDNGDTTYSHEDLETTHVINVLSGKENLNDSDKKEILVDFLTDELPLHQHEGDYGYVRLGDLEKKTFDELTDLAERYIHVENSYGRYVSTEEELSHVIVDPKPSAFDPGLYSALWKLEQECGNPKVRFGLASNKKFFRAYSPGRSFYNPYTNTAVIDLGENETSVNNYIAELSHGKQFDENPILSNVSAARGFVKSAGDFLIARAPSLVDAYDRTYDEPGSLEYDAHKVIEPELRKELKNLTPTRTARQRKVALLDEQADEQLRAEIRKLDEERGEMLDKAKASYLKRLYEPKNVGASDRLREEYANVARQIDVDFQKKYAMLRKQ